MMYLPTHHIKIGYKIYIVMNLILDIDGITQGERARLT